MIAGLVLAAGESSRMGRDKALLDYHGKTFLETIIAALREAGIARIAVVLGHHAEEIRSSGHLGDCTVVVNSVYTRGQTSSLQAGLKAVSSEDLKGVVLCLVDHPAVLPPTIAGLIEAFRESSAPVVIPTYHGTRGHPILISNRLFDELLRLSPDVGANTVLRSYREPTRFVEVNDVGVVLDVDDLEDYRALKSENR